MMSASPVEGCVAENVDPSFPSPRYSESGRVKPSREMEEGTGRRSGSIETGSAVIQ